MENSRPLDDKIDDIMTRLSLFEMRYPITMNPLHNRLVQSEQKADVANVIEENFVPSEDMIRVWKMQISTNAAEITEKGFAYVQCSYPSGEKVYDQDCLEKITKIHQLQNVKTDVQSELDWFSEDYLIPPCLQNYPTPKSTSIFQSLLYNSTYNREIPGFGMCPDELAKLCCDRWLSSDHMYWFAKKINSLQQPTVCVYLNHVSNVKRLTEKLLSSRQDTPTLVIFLINVGSDGDHVFIGDDSNPGFHWTLCLLDRDKKTIFYGDSLGWKMPWELLDKLQPYVDAFCSQNIAEYNVRYCHSPAGAIDTEHACQAECFSTYPLQKDSSICGVVVLLMAGLAFEDKSSFYKLLCESPTLPELAAFQHLSDPTKFSCYLRRVLIAWFAEGRIDTHLLLPSIFVTSEESNTLQMEGTKTSCYLISFLVFFFPLIFYPVCVMQTFHGTYNHDKKDTTVGFAFVRAWHVSAELKTNLRGYAK